MQVSKVSASEPLSNRYLLNTQVDKDTYQLYIVSTLLPAATTVAKSEDQTQTFV